MASPHGSSAIYKARERPRYMTHAAGSTQHVSWARSVATAAMCLVGVQCRLEDGGGVSVQDVFRVQKVWQMDVSVIVIVSYRGGSR